MTIIKLKKWKIKSIKSKSLTKNFIEFGYCFAEILWGQSTQIHLGTSEITHLFIERTVLNLLLG